MGRWYVVIGGLVILIPIIITIWGSFVIPPKSFYLVEFPYTLTVNPSVATQNDQVTILYNNINAETVEQRPITIIQPDGSFVELSAMNNHVYLFPNDFNLSSPKPGIYTVILGNSTTSNHVIASTTMNITSSQFSNGTWLPSNSNLRSNYLLLLAFGSIPAFWKYFEDLKNKRTIQKERKLNWIHENISNIYNFKSACEMLASEIDEFRSVLSKGKLSIENLREFVYSVLVTKFRLYQSPNVYYLDNPKAESFLAKLEDKIVFGINIRILGLDSFDQKFANRQLCLHLEKMYSTYDKDIKYKLFKNTEFTNEFNKCVDVLITRIISGQLTDEILKEVKLNLCLFSFVLDSEINDILSITYSNESAVKKKILDQDNDFLKDDDMVAHMNCLCKENNKFKEYLLKYGIKCL
jgi:hypothetical protein